MDYQEMTRTARKSNFPSLAACKNHVAKSTGSAVGCHEENIIGIVWAHIRAWYHEERRRAGAAGRGACKVRGDAAYYRRLAAIREKKRHKTQEPK